MKKQDPTKLINWSQAGVYLGLSKFAIRPDYLKTHPNGKHVEALKELSKIVSKWMKKHNPLNK